jgi:hypothetical protein
MVVIYRIVRFGSKRARINFSINGSFTSDLMPLSGIIFNLPTRIFPLHAESHTCNCHIALEIDSRPCVRSTNVNFGLKFGDKISQGCSKYVKSEKQLKLSET